MLNVIMLSVVMPNVVTLNVVTLSVVILNVVMLSVVAPCATYTGLFAKYFLIPPDVNMIQNLYNNGISQIGNWGCIQNTYFLCNF